MLRTLVLASSLLLVAATPLPTRTSRLIYDTADVIDDAAERALEPRLVELQQQTGVAIVVLTVPRLDNETISELAVRTGQRWGVGKRGEDRGLVIALARDDREIFVATGYGTESYLPDGRVGALIDEDALPHLREGDLSAGVVSLADSLATVSAHEYGVELTGAPRALPRDAPGFGRLLLLVVFIVVFALLARRHPGMAFALLAGRMFGRGGGFGGGVGGGGFGGGGFGGGGAGRSF